MPELIVQPYTLRFRAPAGTSRGVLRTKETCFVRWREEGPDGAPSRRGYGECALFRGLGADDRPDYGERLRRFAARIAAGGTVPDGELAPWPSIRFGLETARADAACDLGAGILFPSAFTEGRAGIPINGLVWMDAPDAMRRQARELWDRGFRCLKFKVGALDFEEELALLRAVRAEHPPGELELRLDANGAWAPAEAPEKLARLAELVVHSVEQPIRPGQRGALTELCATSPIPIALDEELIGVADPAEKERLVAAVRPPYLVLKPALLGGFAAAAEWIACAGRHGTGWWVTSALESNVGLNALAQWVYGLEAPMVSGLGTGGLFANNIPSPLRLRGPMLFYDPDVPWDYSALGPGGGDGHAR